MSTAAFPSVRSQAVGERAKLALLYGLAVTCAVLLFVGGPDYYSPRSYRAAWSLGHIVTFFLWTCTLIRTSHSFAKTRLSAQLLFVAVITVLLGFTIEWLQTFVGRTFSVADVAGDLTGSMFAISFLSPRRKGCNKGVLRSLQVAIVIFILIQLYPTILAFADEIIARQRFPVLSDLETPLEPSRWKSRFPLSIDTQVVRQGSASLRVGLTPDRYAGLSLVYFPEDWRGYSTLRFSVFNGSRAAAVMTCRIHDVEHIRNGEAYSDRFNQRFKLDPGWNDIAIPLERVKNAPKARPMDLSHIKGLVLFIKDLRTSMVLNIDAVRLE